MEAVEEQQNTKKHVHPDYLRAGQDGGREEGFGREGRSILTVKKMYCKQDRSRLGSHVLTCYLFHLYLPPSLIAPSGEIMSVSGVHFSLIRHAAERQW